MTTTNTTLTFKYEWPAAYAQGTTFKQKHSSADIKGVQDEEENET